MNDLDIVLPLVRCDDPSLQPVGLRRLAHQEGQLNLGNLTQVLAETDRIGPCADLLAREVPDIVCHTQPAARLRPHRMRGQAAIERFLEPLELVLEIRDDRSRPRSWRFRTAAWPPSESPVATQTRAMNIHMICSTSCESEHRRTPYPILDSLLERREVRVE